MLKIIAIDTEYHVNDLGMIDRVYCIAATDRQGATFKYWFEDQHAPGILDEIAAFYGRSDVFFVCHAFSKAERQALKFLGVDLRSYRFVDTYHVARMLSYTLDSAPKVDTRCMSDSDRISFEIEEKKRRDRSLSYAGLCERYGLALIDTEHKQRMRSLCINDRTEGNEAAILDYCAEDTAQLIPLFDKLATEYTDLLRNSFCPILDGQPFEGASVSDVLDILISHCADMIRFGDIADRGIHISRRRSDRARSNAYRNVEALKTEFSAKYPDVLSRDPIDQSWREVKSALLARLSADIERYGMTSVYPKTESGAYSTAYDDIRSAFMDESFEGFGHDYYTLKHELKGINYLMPERSDNGLRTLHKSDDRLHYDDLNLYGSKTGRCQPSTKNFLFGWPKFTYGIIEPPKGKQYVELDFSAQETWLQAIICRDPDYMRIYQGGDLYLGFAAALGMIPAEDYKTLSTDELKRKYHAERKAIKPMILGLSYGMGAAGLAARCNVPYLDAVSMKARIEAAIGESTKYKKCLKHRFDCLTRAISTPDGFVVRVTAGKQQPKTLANWPFQSSGAVILRQLIRMIDEDDAIRDRVLVVATIHDAVFFEVDEGDDEAINRVRDMMIRAADIALNRPTGAPDPIRVGDPDVIHFGDIWTPEHAFDEKFRQLLDEDDSTPEAPIEMTDYDLALQAELARIENEIPF